MIAASALFIMAQATVEEPTPDGPPADWLVGHSPYGMDLTLDGKIWINTNKTGARDDYAILGNDLHRALTNRSIYPKLWIRGYHLRNPKVSFRETKQLVQIDCQRDTIQIERRLHYSASQEVVGSDGPFAADPIVPGSVGESWRRAACTPSSK